MRNCTDFRLIQIQYGRHFVHFCTAGTSYYPSAIFVWRMDSISRYLLISVGTYKCVFRQTRNPARLCPSLMSLTILAAPQRARVPTGNAPSLLQAWPQLHLPSTGWDSRQSCTAFFKDHALQEHKSIVCSKSSGFHAELKCTNVKCTYFVSMNRSKSSTLGGKENQLWTVNAASFSPVHPASICMNSFPKPSAKQVAKCDAFKSAVTINNAAKLKHLQAALLDSRDIAKMVSAPMCTRLQIDYTSMHICASR